MALRAMAVRAECLEKPKDPADPSCSVRAVPAAQTPVCLEEKASLDVAFL